VKKKKDQGDQKRTNAGRGETFCMTNQSGKKSSTDEWELTNCPQGGHQASKAAVSERPAYTTSGGGGEEKTSKNKLRGRARGVGARSRGRRV